MWTYAHPDELYHAGRKGMKKGQHIFCKGAGCASKVHVKTGQNLYDEYLPKGTKLGRIANSDEVIDSKRKYVYATRNDDQTYNEMFDMLDADMFKPLSTYTYSTKKNLRIATGEKVMDDLLKRYGDTTLQDIYKSTKQVESRNIKLNTGDMQIKRLVQTNKQIIEFGRKAAYDHLDEVVNTYRKQGYDAVVDVEDWINNVAEYPLVLLNPKNSISLDTEEKWSEKYT